jgi:2-iminobutanoate/2-iminopropanoate deaminase
VERAVVATTRAPAAIGPYSQGIRAGSFVFTSGQIALDPATGELVPGGIEREAERALQNLEAVLEAAGCGLADVVKVTAFLRDLNDFGAFNGVYARFFPQKPARSCVQVARLPRDAAVEVEAVALLGEGK